MTHFPRPHSTQRAPRLKLDGSVLVAIRGDGAGSVRAKLRELSTTGGLVMSATAAEPVSSVEVARAYARQESVIAEQIKTRTPVYLHDRDSCFSGQSRSFCTRAKTELQQLMLLEGEVHSLSLNETQDSRVSD